MFPHVRMDGVELSDRPKPQIRNTYTRLLGYVRPYWHRAVVVLLLSLAAAFVSVLPVQIMGVAVDEIKIVERMRSGASISSEDSDAPSAPPVVRRKPRVGSPPNRADSVDARRAARSNIPVAAPIHRMSRYVSANWLTNLHSGLVTFLVLGGAFLILQIINHAVSIAHGFIMATLGQRLIFDMRNEVYGHLQKLSLSYFEDRRTGDVMSRAVNDVNSLEQVIVGPVIGFLTDVFRLCWILYFCLTWDWRLTLFGLIVGPVLLVCTFFFGKMIRKGFRELRQKVGELNALLQDNISGIRVIMGFAREEYELERFSEKNRENFAINVRLAKMFTAFRPIIGLLNEAGSVVVLCYGGYKVIQGDLSAGTFVIFFPYLQMLYGPITGLTRFYNHVQRALASTERVFEVLDTEPDIEDAEDAVTLPRLHGHIEFRNVHFSYSNEIEVLTDVNLEAFPGQMIALVGPSGAGKTTITNLIPRFYDPTKGDIFVDGHNLKEVKLKSLREQMALVLQEPFLFNDTVKNNIAYGKLGAKDEDIMEAAKAANAHEFIVQLPKGYESIIGERGVKLSGGQRQRLSIARAILADPRILILDEATSSVDSETEILIQNAIYRLVENRTTFVIAHRLSTIQHADSIVVMDKGRVVERGTHAELLEKGNLYRRLYDVQFRVGELTEDHSAANGYGASVSAVGEAGNLSDGLGTTDDEGGELW